MKLFVKYGKSRKNLPFRPTLRIRDTPYARNHWQEMHFHPDVFCSAGTYPQISLKRAMEIYFSKLRRMNYQAVASTPTPEDK